MGLSLDKTTIDQLNPYLDSHQNKCILEEPPKQQTSGPILFFVLDLKELKYGWLASISITLPLTSRPLSPRVLVKCSPEWVNKHIYKDITARTKRNSRLGKVSDSVLFRQARDVPPYLGEDPDESMEDPPEQEQLADWKLSSPAVAGKIELPKDEVVAAPKEDIVAKKLSAVAKPEVPAPPQAAAPAQPEPAAKPQAAAGQPNDALKQEVSPKAEVAPKPVEPIFKVTPESKAEEPAAKKEEPKIAKQEPAKDEAIEAPKVAAAPPAPAAPVVPVVPVAPVETKVVGKKDEDDDSDGIPEQAVNNFLPHESDAEDDLYAVSSFKQSQEDLCKDSTMPLLRETDANGVNYYSFNFSMLVATLRDEGLYNLYFHACPNYHSHSKIISFNVSKTGHIFGRKMELKQMLLTYIFL